MSDSPLRIVLVSQFALPKICGIAAIIDQVARRLTDEGHDVTHLASSWGRNDASTELPYKLVTVPAWNPLEPRLGVPYPAFAPFKLWRTLNELLDSADVYHAHGFLSQTSTLGFFMARRRPRVATVLTEHVAHVPFANPLIDFAERVAIRSVGGYTARLPDAIVTYNVTVEQSLRSLVPSARLVHIANGVNFDRYRPATAEEREALRRDIGWDARPRVLFVGRLVDKKGAPIAMEAARRANGEFQLVLAGPGTAPPPHPDILYLGPQSQDRVAQLYRAADAFVLPSTGEGFPLSVQEAMASALPVVLSDDPAYRPILAGSGSAVSLVARTPEAVLEGIRNALQNREEASRDALRFAREHFHWQTTADAHIALYRELIAKRRQ